MQIPLKFFKFAAFHHGSLAATGYVVDQTPQLKDLPDVPRPGAIDDPPPVGPFPTFQAPIRDIALLTALDRMPPVNPAHRPGRLHLAAP